MQAIAIACSVLFVIVDFTQAQDDISNTLYTKRYERLDIDTILASPRLVTNYVECLLNKKPCAPEGKALKRILPEALRTKCGRCQPSQKEIALKVITALYFDYPQYYKALREKWDPTGEYNNRFEEYLRDQKFNAIGSGIDSEAGEQAQRPTRQGPGQGVQADELKPSATTNDEKDLPEILNRFGNDEEDSGYDYEKPGMKTSSQAPPVAAALQPSKASKPQQPSSPSQSTPRPQQPAPSVTPAPSRRPSNNVNNSPNSGSASKPGHSHNNSGSNSASVPLPSQTWSHNNQNQNHHQPATVTTTYYLNTQNPVLNIINRITMKFANTAEFIAGMLRGAVPQPQAPIHKDDILRKFCDRLRKTFTIQTNNNNQNKKKHYQRF